MSATGFAFTMVAIAIIVVGTAAYTMAHCGFALR